MVNILNSTKINTLITLNVDDSKPINLSNKFNIKQSGSSKQEEDSKDSGYILSNYSINIPPTVYPIKVLNKEHLFLKLTA